MSPRGRIMLLFGVPGNLSVGKNQLKNKASFCMHMLNDQGKPVLRYLKFINEKGLA